VLERSLHAHRKVRPASGIRTIMCVVVFRCSVWLCAVVFACWSGLTFCNVGVLSMLECTVLFQVTFVVIICINRRNCGVA
jgi:hypothetical protein